MSQKTHFNRFGQYHEVCGIKCVLPDEEVHDNLLLLNKHGPVGVDIIVSTTLHLGMN